MDYAGSAHSLVKVVSGNLTPGCTTANEGLCAAVAHNFLVGIGRSLNYTPESGRFASCRELLKNLTCEL